MVTSIFYGAAFAQLFGTIRKPINHLAEENNQKQESKTINKRIEWWRRNIPWFIFIYYIPINILIFFIQKLYSYKPFELYYWKLIIDFVFLFLVYIAILIHEKRSSILNQPIIIGICLIIFIGEKIGTYRSYDAQLIKNGIYDFKNNHIVFSYENSIVKTNDTILYIGSTSNYIFLYNLQDSSTNIYPLLETKFLTVK